MPISKGLTSRLEQQRPLTDVEYQAITPSDTEAMLEAKKAVLEHKLNMLRQQYEKEYNEYVVVKQKLEEVLAELEKIKKEIEENRGDVEKLKQRYQELYEKAQQLREVLEQKKQKLMLASEQLKKALSLYEQRKKKYEALVSQLKEKAEKLKHLQEILSDKMISQEELKELKEMGYPSPPPGADLFTYYAQIYNKHVIEYNRQVQVVESLLLGLKQDYKSLSKLYEQYEGFYNEYAKSLASYNQTVEQLKTIRKLLMGEEEELAKIIGEYKEKYEQAKALQKITEKEYEDVERVYNIYYKEYGKAENTLKHMYEKALFWQENLEKYLEKQAKQQFIEEYNKAMDKLAPYIFEHEVKPPNLLNPKEFKRFLSDIQLSIAKREIRFEKFKPVDLSKMKLEPWEETGYKPQPNLDIKKTSKESYTVPQGLVQYAEQRGHFKVKEAEQLAKAYPEIQKSVQRYEELVMTPAKGWGLMAKDLMLKAEEYKKKGDVIGTYLASLGASTASFFQGVAEGVAAFVAPTILMGAPARLARIALEPSERQRFLESLANPMTYPRLAGNVLAGYMVGKAVTGLKNYIMEKRGYVHVREQYLVPEKMQVELTTTPKGSQLRYAGEFRVVAQGKGEWIPKQGMYTKGIVKEGKIVDFTGYAYRYSYDSGLMRNIVRVEGDLWARTADVMVSTGKNKLGIAGVVQTNVYRTSGYNVFRAFYENVDVMNMGKSVLSKLTNLARLRRATAQTPLALTVEKMTRDILPASGRVYVPSTPSVSPVYPIASGFTGLAQFSGAPRGVMESTASPPNRDMMRVSIPVSVSVESPTSGVTVKPPSLEIPEIKLPKEIERITIEATTRIKPLEEPLIEGLEEIIPDQAIEPLPEPKPPPRPPSTPPLIVRYPEKPRAKPLPSIPFWEPYKTTTPKKPKTITVPQPTIIPFKPLNPRFKPAKTPIEDIVPEPIPLPEQTPLPEEIEETNIKPVEEITPVEKQKKTTPPEQELEEIIETQLLRPKPRKTPRLKARRSERRHKVQKRRRKSRKKYEERLNPFNLKLF